MSKKPEAYRSESYESEKSKPSSLVAKKDWHIFQPPLVDIKIEKDKPIPQMDSKFHAALKAEGVID